MKKLLFGLIATVMFAFTSNAQSTEKVVGCSADCLFNDCVVKCPSGSIPRCSCILGSFSSCKCQEAIGKVSPKNLELKNKVLDYLKINNFTNFYNKYELLFTDLTNGNQDLFYVHFEELERLISNEPTNASKIEEYINSLK